MYIFNQPQNIHIFLYDENKRVQIYDKDVLQLIESALMMAQVQKF
jgi:hypothetical protein